MKDTKVDKIFNYGIGCVGIIGVLITIITFIVAITQPTQVIAIINQASGITQTPLIIQVTAIGSNQSTPVTLPTYTPYPTDTPLPTSITPVAGGQVFKKQGFVFELIECKGENNITCYLKVTNTESQDKTLYICDGILIDDLGNEYKGSRFWLGVNWGDGSAWNTLIPNVSYNSSIEFQNVNQSATTIAVLRFSNTQSEEFIIEYRNIIIQR